MSNDILSTASVLSVGDGINLSREEYSVEGSTSIKYKNILSINTDYVKNIKVANATNADNADTLTNGPSFSNSGNNLVLSVGGGD